MKILLYMYGDTPFKNRTKRRKETRENTREKSKPTINGKQVIDLLEQFNNQAVREKRNIIQVINIKVGVSVEGDQLSPSLEISTVTLMMVQLQLK